MTREVVAKRPFPGGNALRCDKKRHDALRRCDSFFTQRVNFETRRV